MDKAMANLMREKFLNSWWILKITYAVFFIAAGADKFMNKVTMWDKYVNPALVAKLPITLQHFLYGVGVIEICIGVMILTAMTRMGAYLAGIWLVIISLNLVSMMVYFDIAVRDMVLAICAFVLGHLTEIRDRLVANK